MSRGCLVTTRAVWAARPASFTLWDWEEELSGEKLVGDKLVSGLVGRRVSGDLFPYLRCFRH